MAKMIIRSGKIIIAGLMLLVGIVSSVWLLLPVNAEMTNVSESKTSALGKEDKKVEVEPQDLFDCNLCLNKLINARANNSDEAAAMARESLYEVIGSDKIDVRALAELVISLRFTPYSQLADNFEISALESDSQELRTLLLDYYYDSIWAAAAEVVVSIFDEGIYGEGLELGYPDLEAFKKDKEYQQALEFIAGQCRRASNLAGKTFTRRQVKFYRQYQIEFSLKELKECKPDKTRQAELWYMLAEAYKKNNDYVRSAACYDKVNKVKSDFRLSGHASKMARQSVNKFRQVNGNIDIKKVPGLTRSAKCQGKTDNIDFNIEIDSEIAISGEVFNR